MGGCLPWSATMPTIATSWTRAKHGAGQRHPVDLAPQLAAARPVAQDERQRSRSQEQHGQQGQGIEIVDGSPGKGTPDGRNAERILVRERGTARRREGHGPRRQDEDDHQQPGGQEVRHHDRAPAPRPQGPGREEEERAGQHGHDREEEPLRHRADLPGRGHRAGMRGDPQHGVAVKNPHQPEADSHGQQQPANRVADPADDQRPESGVRHRRDRESHLGDGVVRLEVAPGQPGQDGARHGDQDRPGPQGVDEAQAGPSATPGRVLHRHARRLLFRARRHDITPVMSATGGRADTRTRQCPGWPARPGRAGRRTARCCRPGPRAGSGPGTPGRTSRPRGRPPGCQAGR